MRLLARSVLCAALLGLSLSGCAAGVAADSAPRPSGSSGFRGVVPATADPPRPSFVLHDTTGARYDFAARTAGRPTLLYFGYTHCPDECPTAVADITIALRAVPAALRDRTAIVFVTTDAARDTGPVVRRWLDQWSARFVGLVGTQSELDAAQRATGLEPATKSGPATTIPGHPDEHVHKPGTPPHQHFGPLGYGVAHQDVIFAYNNRDVLPVIYPGGSRPSDIAADLPLLDTGERS